MSTRWYPLYQRGGPQLRVFLPNFWLKLVKPAHKQPANVVQFQCSMEMTKHDIRNYLEKIYNVNVVEVRTRIALGKTYPDAAKGYIKKHDDIKYAYVVLPRDEQFEFPNIFPEDIEKKEKAEQEKAISDASESLKVFYDRNKHNPNMPGWFNK